MTMEEQLEKKNIRIKKSILNVINGRKWSNMNRPKKTLKSRRRMMVSSIPFDSISDDQNEKNIKLYRNVDDSGLKSCLGIVVFVGYLAIVPEQEPVTFTEGTVDENIDTAVDQYKHIADVDEPCESGSKIDEDNDHRYEHNRRAYFFGQFTAFGSLQHVQTDLIVQTSGPSYGAQNVAVQKNEQQEGQDEHGQRVTPAEQYGLVYWITPQLTAAHLDDGGVDVGRIAPAGQYHFPKAAEIEHDPEQRYTDQYGQRVASGTEQAGFEWQADADEPVQRHGHGQPDAGRLGHHADGYPKLIASKLSKYSPMRGKQNIKKLVTCIKVSLTANAARYQLSNDTRINLCVNMRTLSKLASRPNEMTNRPKKPSTITDSALYLSYGQSLTVVVAELPLAVPVPPPPPTATPGPPCPPPPPAPTPTPAPAAGLLPLPPLLTLAPATTAAAAAALPPLTTTTPPPPPPLTLLLATTLALLPPLPLPAPAPTPAAAVTTIRVGGVEETMIPMMMITRITGL
ncbi:hypothetical protein T03_6376 [Trichinella britovi]|uniref:Uncharacterized protein n=1 Tax=Trichinella britovi TaxID=45882 RepID=A0A0V1DF44_TRIBR|nr:hypothetical protein T03_6376 [Trichinella britovi]